MSQQEVGGVGEERFSSVRHRLQGSVVVYTRCVYESKLIQSGNLAGLQEREECGLTGGNGSCPPPLRLILTTGKTKLHLLVRPCAQLLMTHAACASSFSCKSNALTSDQHHKDAATFRHESSCKIWQ